jgi:putative membrane protein
VFASLATLAPVFHPAGAFIGLFIVGHVIGFIVFVLIVLALIFGGRRRRMARWGAYGHFGPGHFGPGGFGPGGFGQWGHAASSAETTLAERFAQGDIDEKEYRARLEVLRANNAGPQVPGK